MSVNVCVSLFACRMMFFYAGEPISVSRLDTRLARRGAFIHVNCSLERRRRFSGASLQPVAKHSPVQVAATSSPVCYAELASDAPE